jgi:hypothetical protein
MRTREQLLCELVDILTHGLDHHTDCVNQLDDLLEDEATASESTVQDASLAGVSTAAQEEWVKRYRSMPPW